MRGNIYLNEETDVCVMDGQGKLLTQPKIMFFFLQLNKNTGPISSFLALAAVKDP